jgi:dinuclear metal center YbgI/SA1388 family protein
VTDKVPLEAIATFLDEYLDVVTVPDYPNAVNGLQVQNSGTVGYIVAAVDAAQATIDGAVDHGDRALGPGLMVVHHGLFWDGNIPLTGRRYRRVRSLLQHDLALYSAHLPLDLHAEVGNNVQVANRLGLEIEGHFGTFKGTAIGVFGQLPIDRTTLVSRLNQELGTEARLLAGGPESCQRVGIVTGGAGDMIAEAVEVGCDTFITGEGAHHTFFDAHEWGINVIYAGHYATEQLGVQVLAGKVSERFRIPWSFHDHPTGL